MAARPSLFCNRHDAVLRPRNSAPDEQKIPLSIHLHDAEAQLGVPLGTHVTRHPLSLDDTRRVGAGANGAGLPVPRVTVTGRTTAEPVALDDALETTALRRSCHLYQLARGEDID